jgi:hypothetical protein
MRSSDAMECLASLAYQQVYLKAGENFGSISISIQQRWMRPEPGLKRQSWRILPIPSRTTDSELSIGSARNPSASRDSRNSKFQAAALTHQIELADNPADTARLTRERDAMIDELFKQLSGGGRTTPRPSPKS